MEGTNENGTLPNRQHSSATPSPRATFTPSFHNKGPFWKTMVFIQLWEVLTCGSPTSRTSNGGRSSPSLANDLWFTHMLNVQRWEVFASACDLWFTHVLNAFVNTNTVTRGSTARATHRAVPLPNRRRPPKVLVCLQKFILCPPFQIHASSFSFCKFPFHNVLP